MLRLNASLLLRFLSLAVLLILAIVVLPAQAQGAVFHCSDLATQTDNDMTAAGSWQDVEVNGETGDLFCRVIVRDTGVNTSLSEIGMPIPDPHAVVQAVDIYGLLPNGTTVLPFKNPIYLCLRGQGILVFLNAADTTRQQYGLTPDSGGTPGYTCDWIESSGTVVLFGTLGASATPMPIAVSGDLLGCLITTRATLRLRSFPSTASVILASIPARTTLAATAHSTGWYQVTYQDLQGWVSASYVTAKGECK